MVQYRWYEKKVIAQGQPFFLPYIKLVDTYRELDTWVAHFIFTIYASI